MITFLPQIFSAGYKIAFSLKMPQFLLSLFLTTVFEMHFFFTCVLFIYW